MNYRSTLLIALAFAGAVTSSCKKDYGRKDGSPKDPPANDSSRVDVYAAGYIYDNGSTAAYWKNDTLKKLGLGRVTSIAVKNNDVYMAGYSFMANGKFVATYWKNGIRTLLADSAYSSEANGIAISDNDVYISGSIFPPTQTSLAIYWKNGMLNFLGNTAADRNSGARGLLLQNNDIYVAGDLEKQDRTDIATYWKNGQPVSLKAGKNDYYSQLVALTINGNDIYAAGSIYTLLHNDFTGYEATYWKNGTPVSLAGGGASYSAATSISVKNNDIYISGNKIIQNKLIGGYWKNGIFVELIDGFGSSEANALAIRGDDIYVGGSSKDPGNTSDNYPTYWKNGKPVRLFTGEGDIFAVTVVRK